MPEHSTDPDSDYVRERALYRYSAALERGDLNAVDAVLREAEGDAALESAVNELNALYAEADDARVQEQNVATVSRMLSKHLAAARAVAEPAELPPLTVGAVAARVQEDVTRQGRGDADVLSVTQKLSGEQTPLPGDLSAPSVRRLFHQLGIDVSDRFRKLFRQRAIDLSMGRRDGAFRLAATRQQRERRGDDTEGGTPGA